MRLAGKVAIISGAASGMGAATARMFAREGAKVVIAHVLEHEGREVADAIGASGPRPCHGCGSGFPEPGAAGSEPIAYPRGFDIGISVSRQQQAVGDEDSGGGLYPSDIVFAATSS
jgi:NAD(P)-dependent dehydrogenase (short-subunit alcohol dehydrogenase family)